MIAALLSGIGVEISTEHEPDGAAAFPEGQEVKSRELLWVADESANPLEILRFLGEGGPSARVVTLGSFLPTDPGSAGQAAIHDGYLIQIEETPSQTAIQGALRRAIIGWTS